MNLSGKNPKFAQNLNNDNYRTDKELVGTPRCVEEVSLTLTANLYKSPKKNY